MIIKMFSPFSCLLVSEETLMLLKRQPYRHREVSLPVALLKSMTRFVMVLARREASLPAAKTESARSGYASTKLQWMDGLSGIFPVLRSF